MRRGERREEGREGREGGGRGPISSVGPGPPKHVKTALPGARTGRQCKHIMQLNKERIQ